MIPEHFQTRSPQHRSQLIIPRCSTLLASKTIVKIHSCHTRQFDGRRAINCRARSLLQRLRERPHNQEQDSVEPPVAGQIRGDHVSRMQAEYGYTLWLPGFGKVTSKEDVTQLRVVVCHHVPVFGRWVRGENGGWHVFGCDVGESESFYIKFRWVLCGWLFSGRICCQLFSKVSLLLLWVFIFRNIGVQAIYMFSHNN